MTPIFEWDPDKAALNIKKHQLSFEIAARVFSDRFALVVQHRIENGELRWQTLGMVEGYVLLLVAHTVRSNEDGSETIRIISARRADKSERRMYEQNYSQIIGSGPAAFFD
ncbi:BrnT family toxin [Comamonas sp. J-3]|jgi:hypothetical protein|uniref:BrnT family toxin n=1 Tax=Comamonas trifloxystrobinivorans TaxID=3350256 RepID=UPI003726D6E0